MPSEPTLRVLWPPEPSQIPAQIDPQLERALGEVAHRIIAVTAVESTGATGREFRVKKVAIASGIGSTDRGDVRRAFEIADQQFGARFAKCAHDQ